MTLSTGTRLGRYEIRSKLGEGGMGEVYLAEDTRLHRKVALKILSVEIAANSDRMRRFEQEAQAAAALNHPNILTVYDIGEADGKSYIATELIDGHTLREHLAQAEPLPLKTILKIGVQVAEALSAAHAAGISHRDIKPENIMIRRDGYAKVLDFGLAKLSQLPAPAKEPGGSEDATRVQVNTTPGMVMGTVNYMSPEQARGLPTDARTDIWSLGVVLYEMLAKRVPFTGETVNHTIVAILEKEPQPPENAPAELQRIIRKALTKDVEMRYQSARDLLIDLKNLRRDLDIQGEIERSTAPIGEESTGEIGENKTVFDSALATKSAQVTPTQNSKSSSSSEYTSTRVRSYKLVTTISTLLLLAILTIGYFALTSRRSSSAGKINSIAVMPFVNASGNADVEYLSDGLTDSLIFRFSQLPNLKVSPTSTVMRFKGTTKDVADIARELDVNAVVSGRLMKVGDGLTISVQLIDARSQKLIWAEQYDRKMADLMTTQREIAMTLTQKMQLQLAEDERGITKKYTTVNDAYQLYLKGRFHYARRTKDDMLKAIESYQQAIELDPKFALAYAAIAEVYNSMGKNPDVPPKDCIPLAKQAALRALEIDPMLPQAHSALGDSLALYDWDWAESERHFKKALELDPNISYTHVAYGLGYLAAMGKSDALVTEIERAVALEPLSLINNSVLTSAYVYDRKYEKALAQARSSYDLDPAFPLARVWLGFALIANGKYDEAISAVQKEPPESSFGWMSLVVIAQAYAHQGKRADAERQISLLRDLAKKRYIRTYYLAAIYATLGDKDKAFAELEQSFADKDCFLGRIAVDPSMDPLRDDPRFKSIIRRMNLSE